MSSRSSKQRQNESSTMASAPFLKGFKIAPNLILGNDDDSSGGGSEEGAGEVGAEGEEREEGEVGEVGEAGEAREAGEDGEDVEVEGSLGDLGGEEDADIPHGMTFPLASMCTKLAPPPILLLLLPLLLWLELELWPGVWSLF